jgi:hypothetical protein
VQQKGGAKGGSGGDNNGKSHDPEESFGFAGLEEDGRASPAGVSPVRGKSSEDGFGFGSDPEANTPPSSTSPDSGSSDKSGAKKPSKRQIQQASAAAQVENTADDTPKEDAPNGADADASAPSGPTDDERAAKLAKLRALRKEKKADYMADLNEALKIIDDLPEI